LCVYNEQYVLLKTDNNAHVIKCDIMNYSQIMSPVPLCLEKWGVMTPRLLWERHPWVIICSPMHSPPENVKSFY